MKPPPLYVSLRILEKVLNNSMIDTGASHNLMPLSCRSVGLELTCEVVLWRVLIPKMYQPNIFHSQPLVKHLIDVSVVNIKESFSMLIDRKGSDEVLGRFHEHGYHLHSYPSWGRTGGVKIWAQTCIRYEAWLTLRKTTKTLLTTEGAEEMLFFFLSGSGSFFFSLLALTTKVRTIAFPPS